MTVDPVTRILRTCAQVVAAIGVVLPTVVALLATVGVHLDGVALATTAGAAVAVVAAAQNAWEQVRGRSLGATPTPTAGPGAHDQAIPDGVTTVPHPSD